MADRPRQLPNAMQCSAGRPSTVVTTPSNRISDFGLDEPLPLLLCLVSLSALHLVKLTFRSRNSASSTQRLPARSHAMPTGSLNDASKSVPSLLSFCPLPECNASLRDSMDTKSDEL